jgi:hypothetical protein
MTWYYVTAIVVAMLVCASGIIVAIIKGVWTLGSLFGDLKSEVKVLTVKVENVQFSQNSLQARTIRLEEKVDRLG